MGDNRLVGPLHLLDPAAGPGEQDTKRHDGDRGKRLDRQRGDLHTAPRISHQSSPLPGSVHAGQSVTLVLRQPREVAVPQILRHDPDPPSNRAWPQP